MNFVAIKDILKLVMSNVWIFLKPIVDLFMSEVGKALREVAIEAVGSLLSVDTLTNEEKRKEAFLIIVTRLKEKGIKLSDSVINMAIEVALQKLKTK